ncbi:MAG: hypothetical protein KC933_10600 [Myxococcales bacterium]|nr:hypothetical protein [Myxococcales bacterium]
MSNTLLRRGLLALAFAAASGLPSTSRADAPLLDPCDFTRASAFTYQDVITCFESVPWCSDPTDPVRCDRDNLLDVIDANFEQFSSLRGNYDARIEWRARVAAMRSTTFANDYAQYQAVSNLLEDFRDAHWYYGGPPCYEQMFFASIPLDFGSAYTRTRPGHAREQIIYLEAPYVGLTDWYLAITGIDLTQYEGMRVVSIDGQGVLDYFRDFGADVLRDDDDPGVNLMGVLEFGYWSLRMGKTYPTAPSVTLVLETRRGHRQSVVLPWVFAPAGLFGVPVPVPASTAEFEAACFQTYGAAAAAAGAMQLQDVLPFATEARALQRADRSAQAPMGVSFERIARRNLIDRLEGPDPSGRGPRLMRFTEYYEVPDWALDRDITEVLPLSDGARVVEYAGDTVAIQLNYDFVQPWRDEVAAGVAYACEHADRLIIDLRDNFGGYIGQADWLARHLAPQGATRDTRLVVRDLVTSPALNELRAYAEQVRAIAQQLSPGMPLPPCAFTSMEASCSQSLATGQIVTDPLWYLEGDYQELRGDDEERLSPEVMFADYALDYLGIPPIPCPGKFTGKDLIVLVNGENASCGVFGAELVRAHGTLVVAGGYVGEAMAAGQARGGNVLDTTYYVDTQDFIAQLASTYVPEYAGATRYDLFQFALPRQARDVALFMEERGIYHRSGTALLMEAPPVGDVQIPFWSNSRDTDGAAYRATVSAVERQAVIEPLCGAPEAQSSCRAYDRCAGRALAAAVEDGRTTVETALRTFIDAAAECVLSR